MECEASEPVVGAPTAPAAGMTVNVNTITNFFAAAPGPTSAQEDPNAWLPRDNDAGRPTRRTRDGTLLGKCSHPSCKHPTKGVKEFAPGDNSSTGVRTRLSGGGDLFSTGRPSLRHRTKLAESMRQRVRELVALGATSCLRCLKTMPLSRTPRWTPRRSPRGGDLGHYFSRSGVLGCQ